MATTEASIEIAAPLAEVWGLYFERSRWASWVDGFASVTAESGYPEADGTLSWRSTPAGRGQVDEHVIAHEPSTLHRIDFRDPASVGELEVSFEMLPAEAAESGRRTKVTQRLTYRLTGGGPLAAVTDVLFIRSQMRGSLQRSLSDLRLEAERAGGTQGAF